MNGPCSQSCGHGNQGYKRTKLVESKNGGHECVGSFQKSESCFIQDCPVAVDCRWSEWHYGLCSRSCGSGQQVILRTEKVKAKNGGRPCIGKASRTEHCNIQDCPVDCQWSEWHYGSCSKSCGIGELIALRTEIVKSKNGGRSCFGSRSRTEHCNIQDCAVDCQWSEWIKEGECSRSCGGGKQMFIRTEKVRATNGGRPCFGKELKIETCNNHDCGKAGK